jgi:hypothetical protein
MRRQASHHQKREGRTSGPRITTHRSTSLLDIVMLALGLGFFAVAVGYTYACERL